MKKRLWSVGQGDDGPVDSVFEKKKTNCALGGKKRLKYFVMQNMS